VNDRNFVLNCLGFFPEFLLIILWPARVRDLGPVHICDRAFALSELPTILNGDLSEHNDKCLPEADVTNTHAKVAFNASNASDERSFLSQPLRSAGDSRSQSLFLRGTVT